MFESSRAATVMRQLEPIMSVIDEIQAERQRQLTIEGWTAEHDDGHVNGELAMAAACFAVDEHLFRAEMRPTTSYAPLMAYVPLWPWDDDWWKPRDRRQNLILAAALIVAEIERLDRAAGSP